MKNYLLLMFLFGFLHITAQENLSVRISNQVFNAETQPAFIVDIPQADSKDVIKMWENQLAPRNIFDTFKKLPKMKKESKEKWVMSDVVVNEICPDTLTIYTRIISLQDHITFGTMFQSPKGFIGAANGNREINVKASTYVRNFAVEMYKDAVDKEIDELEIELKKMENNYNQFDKDNKKLTEKSSESQSNIIMLSDEGQANSIEQGSYSFDQLKEREKQLKKEQKATKKYLKKIEENQREQTQLKLDIEKKKQEIVAAKDKWINIK